MPPEAGAGRFSEEAEYDDFVRRQREWPLDFVTISVDRGSGGVQLSCGSGGRLPVFACIVGGDVVVSSEMHDLLASGADQSIDCQMMASALVGTLPYSSRTPFKAIRRLTERATLSASRQGLHVDYPVPAPVFSPTTIRKDADIVTAFLELLSLALRRWPSDVRLGAEFSGGYDSAVTAAIGAQHGSGPFAVYGLIVEGGAQEQQLWRRGAALDDFQWQETRYFIQDTVGLPAPSAGIESYVSAPDNADLQVPLRILLSRFQEETGARAVLTGTGGDELMMPHPEELDSHALTRQLSEAYIPSRLPEWLKDDRRHELPEYLQTCERAPGTVVPLSVLSAFAARAALFHCHGLHPINLYAEPDLIRFCRSLPAPWRKNKRLLQDALLRLGYRESFLKREKRENFVPFLRRSLDVVRLQWAQALRDGCHLHDAGVVDADGFIAALEDPRSHEDLNSLSYLIYTLNAEHMMRQADMGVAG